jgi:proline racemase
VRAARYFAAVDSHTEGMPTRVITGGIGPIPGATMLERKLHFEEHLDELRQLLMREPRGHGGTARCRGRSCSPRPARTPTGA